MMSHEEVEKQARELVHEFFMGTISGRELEKRTDKLGEENDAKKIISTVFIETGAGEMILMNRQMRE